MQKQFLTLLFALIGISFSTLLPQKRLVLHVDVNKTIIAMDLVQGKQLDETVNGILAEFTICSMG